MEKILFPVKIMNITQGMNGGHSHKGTKAIDCGWVNEENKKLYAPFTGKIAQIKTDSNAVWFQSKEKVLFADGSIDYATVRTVHDNDVSDLYVGKEIKQGEYYYKMGNKGNATGVHVHIEISKGHVKGYAPQNKYGNWEMPNTINVYDGFCLADYTTVQDGEGYPWKKASDVKEPEQPKPQTKKFNIGDKVVISGKLYKSSNAESASGSVNNKTTNITRYAEGAKHPYNTTGDLGWMDEADIKLVSEEIIYVVQPGDNLSVIAKKFNTTWQKIYEDNKEVIGNDPDIIQPNQRLVIR